MPSTHHQHATAKDHSQEHHHPGHDPADDGQAQILDLDAKVLAGHIAAITAWLPVSTAPTEIVDLGAGTGAGSFALLHQFPQAQLTAVDSSAAHLEQLQTRAHTANLSDQVRTVQADLNAREWPDLGAPDLVWASASMHHLAYPDEALRKVRDLLGPTGLLAVVELAGLPRFLPPNAPDDAPGLEERLHAATEHLIAEHLPHRGADWAPLLIAAGFTPQDSLTINVDVSGADDDAVAPYALAAFQGLRNAAADALSADDRAAVDQLLDTTSPRCILHRADLAVRTTRTVWVARRASERS